MNNTNNPTTNLKTQSEPKKIRNPFHNIKPFYSLPQCEKKIYKKFHKNYSSKSNNFIKLNDLIINEFIFNKNTHIVSIFKDHMIFDFIDEFLKRSYNLNETHIRIPRFAAFYKNYLKFFCKPTFTDFICNEIIQEHSEKKAEIYYNQNFKTKKNKNNGGDEGLIESSSSETDENDKNKEKISKSKIEKSIFDSSVRENIDNTELVSVNYNLEDETIILSEKEIKMLDEQSNFFDEYSKESSLLKMLNNKKNNNNKIISNSNNNLRDFKYINNNNNFENKKSSKLISYTNLCYKKKNNNNCNINKNNFVKNINKIERNNKNLFNKNSNNSKYNNKQSYTKSQSIFNNSNNKNN